MNDKKFYLSEEILIIRHSGEIPEVTYHGSLHYLSEDPEGPHIDIARKDLLPLKTEVINRYRTIILRDLLPENRDKGLYRGVARSIANWHRLCKFCNKEKREISAIQEEIAETFLKFIRQELNDVNSSNRKSCINCDSGAMSAFAEDLGLSSENLPPGWQVLCK